MSRKRKAGEELSATGRKRNGNQIQTVTPVSAKSALAARSQSARTRVEDSVTEHTHQISTDSEPHSDPSASDLVQSLRRTTVEKVQRVTKASGNSSKKSTAPRVVTAVRAERKQHGSEGPVSEDRFDHVDEASDSMAPEQDVEDESDSRLLTEAEYPRSWKRAREEIVSKTLRKPSRSSIIQVCGSNGTGKGTFVEYLVDSLLHPPEELGLQRCSKIAILDLEPTRELCTYSGHISLTRYHAWSQEHQVASSGHISCIPVGLFGQRNNAEHFLMAAKQLLDKYKTDLPATPLLVRSPSFDQENERGMTAGTASRLMSLINADTICCLQPPDSGMAEVTGVVTNSVCPIWQLESIRGTSSKSPAVADKSRQASMKAYFHEYPDTDAELSDQLPMAVRKPYAISYDVSKSHFGSVFLFGDVPPNHPFMLSRILNGSVVAIFVLEEWAECGMFDETEISKCDNIPFELGSGGSSPDPKILLDGKTIGLALVRSIDVENRLLYILTPESTAGKLKGVHPSRILLVHGIADSPDWAFKEDLDAGLQPYYLGTAKRGMQIVKSRRFKKSG